MRDTHILVSTVESDVMGRLGKCPSQSRQQNSESKKFFHGDKCYWIKLQCIGCKTNIISEMTQLFPIFASCISQTSSTYEKEIGLLFKQFKTMGWIVDHYKITYNDLFVGSYYVYEDNTCRYYVNSWKNELEPIKDLLEKKGLLKDKDTKRPIAGRKRSIYHCDGLTLERIPNETNERFLVYQHDANKGQPGYSDKDHSAPHYEGEKTPEGMREWTTWYAFVKMDDGTYEAALDESWWWGGGHNDGGTIHTDIPEEWFELSYDEFLENVVTLSAASHYGFTPDELKEKQGLKEFFGFE